MAAHWIAFEIKVDIHVFSESRGVVISVSFGITKCFKYHVRPDENVFDSISKQRKET